MIFSFINILGGNRKKEWIVFPLAFIADIPVEANITKFFFELSLKYSNRVVFPVPAFPVIKRFCLEYSIRLKISLNSGSNSIFSGISL